MNLENFALDVFEKAGALILVFIFLVVLPTAIVYSIASISAEADCLEKGYPRSAVSWKFDKYCMNLEGTLTIRVDEIE